MLLYSEKFLRVQNFMESPLRAPEDIFVASTHTGRQGAIDIALEAIFMVFIFTEADLSQNFAPSENYPLYGNSPDLNLTERGRT